jgi:hypothetical protein
LGDVNDIGERFRLGLFARVAWAKCIPFERVIYEDVPIAGAASHNG